MVHFYQPKDTAGEIGQLFGGGAAQGYMNRADELALQRAMERLPSNAKPKDILNSLVGTKTYSPEAKQNAFKNLFAVREVEEAERTTRENEKLKSKELDIRRKEIETKNAIAKSKNEQKENDEASKRNRDIAGNRALLKQAYPDKSDEEIDRLSNELPPDTVKTIHTKETKPTKQEKAPPKSEFDKIVGKKSAEAYFQAKQEIPKLKDTLSNVNRIRELSQTLRGPLGYVKAKSGFSKNAEEIDSLGLVLIDPILKVFNPVGAIPTAKINLIKEKYAVKSTDTQQQIDGKLSALERFVNQALQRNNDKIALYEQFDGNPPPYEIEQFDADTATLADVMLDEKTNKTNRVRVKNKKTGQTGTVTLTDKNRDKYDVLD